MGSCFWHHSYERAESWNNRAPGGLVVKAIYQGGLMAEKIAHALRGLMPSVLIWSSRWIRGRAHLEICPDKDFSSLCPIAKFIWARAAGQVSAGCSDASEAPAVAPRAPST